MGEPTKEDVDAVARQLYTLRPMFNILSRMIEFDKLTIEERSGHRHEAAVAIRALIVRGWTPPGGKTT